jgi:hypothetical protein
MQWFRSHSRLGSGVAIVSLALQLALSFGHIHHKDIFGPTHSSATAAAATAIAAVSDERPAPAADHDTDEHENQYCAIYAINSLLSFAQQSEPPSLPVQPSVERAPSLGGYTAPLPDRRRVASQARAPPTA